MKNKEKCKKKIWFFDVCWRLLLKAKSVIELK